VRGHLPGPICRGVGRTAYIGPRILVTNALSLKPAFLFRAPLALTSPPASSNANTEFLCFLHVDTPKASTAAGQSRNPSSHQRLHCTRVHTVRTNTSVEARCLLPMKRGMDCHPQGAPREGEGGDSPTGRSGRPGARALRGAVAQDFF
jgi:hypothetical protein